MNIVLKTFLRVPIYSQLPTQARWNRTTMTNLVKPTKNEHDEEIDWTVTPEALLTEHVTLLSN